MSVEQQPVEDPDRQFYVTCCNDEHGPRRSTIAMLGPFETHREALGLVDAAIGLANRLDCRAPWYLYGTCSSPRDIPLKVSFTLADVGVEASRKVDVATHIWIQDEAHRDRRHA